MNTKDLNSVGAPYQGALEVTPDDDEDIPGGPFRGVILTVSGTVKMTMLDGSTPTFPLAAGICYPFVVKRIWATPAPPSGVHVLK